MLCLSYIQPCIPMLISTPFLSPKIAKIFDMLGRGLRHRQNREG